MKFMNYPIKSFDDDKMLVTMDHDSGEFYVEILRDEINPQWNTETLLCKITEPFILYYGKSEHYTEEYNYIVFSKYVSSGYVNSNANLYKKPKDANKQYLAEISRLDVD